MRSKRCYAEWRRAFDESRVVIFNEELNSMHPTRDAARLALAKAKAEGFIYARLSEPSAPSPAARIAHAPEASSAAHILLQFGVLAAFVFIIAIAWQRLAVPHLAAAYEAARIERNAVGELHEQLAGHVQ
jgi:hypothetical protein